MPPVAFLALLTMAALLLAALRLEMNFRRTAAAGSGSGPRGEPEAPRPEHRAPGARPELRAPPAGGYWQAPFSRAA